LSNRILVVDDDPTNCELLEAILQPYGFDVQVAHDGEQGVAAVSSGEIDLVLLDVMMPGISGYEACRRIRKELGNVGLPVVFLTALSDRESRIRGKSEGADDFVSKPIDAAELMPRVRRLLQTKAFQDDGERRRLAAEAELEKMKAELLHADRLATLGTLAGGVGHEVNNIVVVLRSLLREMKGRAAEGLPLPAEDIEELATVEQHLTLHGRQLLELGRPGPEGEEALDLRDVVARTLSMLKTAGRTKYAQVTLDAGEAPIPLLANRTRLEQVIVNLVGNAADAVEDTKDRPKAISLALRLDGGRASCRIEDTGCGIPADKLERIFAPYYTTKPAGKGTGLGLPVVKRIVESAGGTLTVESELAKGSAFTFTLPLAP
jgi:C4-dicarboxylate-specific signal transduction histidine kinase